MRRIRLAILLGLVLIDALVLATAIHHGHVVVPGSSVAGNTCIAKVYLVKFPQGMGPWNGVLYLYNETSHEYYPLVLVPWPLRARIVWSSTPSAWTALTRSIGKPIPYIRAGLPLNKTTIYEWSLGSKWLAILPCNAPGYSSSELASRLLVVAESRPLKRTKLVLLEPIRDDTMPQAIALPLAGQWSHVYIYESRGSLSKPLVINAHSLMLLLEKKITDEIALSKTGNIVRNLSVRYVRFISLGNLPGPVIELYDKDAFGISYYGGLSLISNYVYSPGPLGLRVYVHEIDRHSSRKASLFANGVAPPGHVFVTLQSPRSYHIDVKLTEQFRPIALVSFFDSIYAAHISEPPMKGAECGPVVKLVVANQFPVQSPGALIPVYMGIATTMVTPFSSLRIRLVLDGDVQAKLLVNGLEVCSGVGGCTANVTYPTLYPLLAEYVSSGGPLAVAVLVNRSTEVKRLEITYSMDCLGHHRADILVLEPLDPESLHPLGIIVIGNDAAHHRISVRSEALTALRIRLLGAAANKTGMGSYAWPPEIKGLRFFELLTQMYPSDVVKERATPLWSLAKASAAPILILEDNTTLTLLPHGRISGEEITYEPKSPQPVLEAEALGVPTPVTASIRLGGLGSSSNRGAGG